MKPCLLIASLGILTGQPSPAAAAPPTLAPSSSLRSELKADLADRKITLHLKSVSLPDVIAHLASETGLPVLADAFPDDPVVVGINVEGVPLAEAVQQVSRLYSRDAFIVDGVLVLRHSNWTVKSRYVNPIFRWHRSAGAGRLMMASNAQDGARAVQGALSNIRAGALADEVGRVLQIPFSVQRPLTDRRVSLDAAAITPTRLAGALVILLNASPAITISQTKEQQAGEEALYRQALDTRSKDDKLSDELKQDLAKLLTPEQVRAVANGERVDIPFSGLPPQVRERANRYLDLRWSLVTNGTLMLGENTLERSREFGLILTRYPLVGISGFFEDGGRFAF